MTQEFHELLLSELRMVSYQPGDPDGMTDDLLCEAVTMNENLRSLGFTLRPGDLLRLAVSPSLETFFDALRALVPDVKARPMYPGFPQQVMDMSRAEFRMHQMIHYFTTYGLESLLGREVRRGWLPEYDGPERTEEDTALMECRVIELVPERDAPFTVLKALLNRRERLTNPELALVKECAPLCDAQQLQGLKVRFKENIALLFPLMMELSDRKAALQALHALCGHTGDVLRCGKDYLGTKRWHLATGEKKLLVKLLESYPPADFRRNLMKSLHIRERSLLVLQHLDYNRFSRSGAHREAVRALRDGELLSWFGTGEKLLRERRPEALDYYARRPGYMLRMISRLLSLGYARENIEKALLPHADCVSGHLTVKTIRILMNRRNALEKQYARARADCLLRYRTERLTAAPNFEAFCSRLKYEADSRRRTAADVGYRQPMQEARRQAYREADKMEDVCAEKEKEVLRLKRILARIADWPQISGSIRLRRNACADLDDDLYAAYYRDHPEDLQEALKPLEEELASLKAQLDTARAAGDRQFMEQRTRIEEAYAAELSAISAWEQRKSAHLEEDCARETAAYAEARRTLPERQAAELAALEKRHAQALEASQYDPQTVEILKKLLKEHFLHAVTPLKGKTVFADLDPFDLEHSTLETEDRSKDGGYIRSGISYRIPQDARYVRFFVYWNDRARVDLDLHAGGLNADGQPLHVGWNADFRSSGVVHSGDITHSDAAEYIDIDLSAPVREIYANIHLFYGKPSFDRIGTCYVGLMAVDRIGQKVKHYSHGNCFFTHRLTQKTRSLFYGYINVRDRFVRFVGQPNQENWGDSPAIETAQSLFSLKEYLDCIMDAQSARFTRDPDKADVILTMGKSPKKNALSLVDSNFFLEC